MAGRSLVGPAWLCAAYALAFAQAYPYVELMGGWGSPWAWLLFFTPFPVVVEPFTYKAVSVQQESEK